mgnify:CR=1 FL=1
MDKKEIEEYQATIRRIKEFLEHEKELSDLFGGNLQVVKKAFEIMMCQLEKLRTHPKVEATEEECKIVEESINLFFTIASTQPIIQIFRNLSKDYLVLAYNWNREIWKNPRIETKIRAIHAIVEAQLTILDTINLLKILLEKVKEILKFSPPAFELSRHYLESLFSCQSDKTSTGSSNTKKRKKKKKIKIQKNKVENIEVKRPR